MRSVREGVQQKLHTQHARTDPRRIQTLRLRVLRKRFPSERYIKLCVTIPVSVFIILKTRLVPYGLYSSVLTLQWSQKHINDAKVASWFFFSLKQQINTHIYRYITFLRREQRWHFISTNSLFFLNILLFLAFSDYFLIVNRWINSFPLLIFILEIPALRPWSLFVAGFFVLFFLKLLPLDWSVAKGLLCGVLSQNLIWHEETCFFSETMIVYRGL